VYNVEGVGHFVCTKRAKYFSFHRGNAAGAANKVRAGDVDSVLDFVQNYGSHYVQSVSVGDAIYQVRPKSFFVPPRGFGAIGEPKHHFETFETCLPQKAQIASSLEDLTSC